MPDNEASEPTSTLVLTSGGNHFVDIRILKAQEEDHTKSPGELGMNHVLPHSQLEWAFGGSSSTTWRNDDDDREGRKIAHCQWRHYVDSRYRDAAEVADEGDMFPQPPPHTHRTLERGRMVNPTNGRMSDYEEVWLDVAAATKKDEETGEATVLESVLRLCDEDDEARGMVVRVGQFVQGVLRVGESFACERWEWKKDQGWEREARVGDLFLPCGAAMEESKLALGGKVKYGGYEWEVIELVNV
nr:hypothetical protein CFP56_10473 [Quercus suber]